MKRFFAALMCVVIVFSFGACASKETKDNEKLSIVTTIFPLYDIARQIGGEKVNVTLLLPSGAEVHSYEPSVQDVIKIRESDIFMRLGMEADPWTDSVIEDADLNNLNVFSAMKHIDLIKDSKEEHHHESLYDQHVWTSVENTEEIADEFKEVLIRLDRKNAAFYERNEEKFSKNLSKLDDKFERLAERNRGKVMVFADRFPFRYFADEYDIRYFAAFPGCSSESEPSAATVSKLIDMIKKDKIPIVFYTETSNKQLADAICEETGAEKMLFHSCHTVTEEELNAGITYTDLMEKNYEVLKKAFGENS